MSGEEFREQSELYVLGVLEEPERSEVLAQLESGGEASRGEIRRAAMLVSALAASAPLVEPPARLRRRVLASVGMEPRHGSGWMMQAIAALSLACLAAAGYFGWQERGRNADLSAGLSQAHTEAAKLNEVMSLLNAPDTVVRVSGEGTAAPPKGRVFLNPSRGVLLIASNLPPAPAGKTYEMWVIPRGANPVPAGLFQSEANGTALHILRGPVNVATTGAIAVTLEAEGGALQPTSTPLIVAAL